METLTMAVFFRKYLLRLFLLTAGASLVSCSLSDDNADAAEPSRIVISGHVFEKDSGEPMGGERVLMTRNPAPSSTPAVAAVPDTAWTTSSGFYSFETDLRRDKERFDLQAGFAFNIVTVSRGDQSFDADLGSYILENVDFFL